MNLKNSMFWAGLLRFVVRGFTFVKIIVLARILTPYQFGIFGIASLVLGFLEMLTETGVNIVLVQKRDKINDFINTSWVVSIVRGIFIALLIVLFSPAIFSFFDVYEPQTILYLVAAIPLIRGFINPSIVKFQKDFQFEKEFKFRSVLIATDVFVSVVLGVLLRNELALVWGMIFAAFVEVIISNLIVSPRPRLEFDREKLREVIGKGKWITGAKIFDYLFSHGDDIVVGRLLGSVSLGIYQQAYKISSLPIVEVAEVFQRVTFPYYSKLSDKKDELLKLYLKTLKTTLLLIIPFGIVIYIFPELIISVLLGNNWLEAAGVLKVLAIFGIVKTAANSSFPLLLGVGQQDKVAYLTLFGIVGLGMSIMPLIETYGLEGAGYAAIIGSLVMIPPAYYWIRRSLS